MDNQIVNQPTQTREVPLQVIAPVPLPLANPTKEPIQNPPKNSNLFLTILIIVIIILGIIFGVLVTKYISTPGSSIFPTPTPTLVPFVTATPFIPPLIAVNESDVWITYSNTASQYSINYPPGWKVSESSQGKLVEIYNQSGDPKSIGKILIEKIDFAPRNINQYVDIRYVGTIPIHCFSESPKTWCYIENGKTIKISILIIRDSDDSDNSLLDKIFSTFSFTPSLANITESQLSTGWYWGNKEQKLPGTPTTWIYTDEGKSSCWHKVDVVCQQAPSSD